jgi:hypothetical protein
MEIIKEIFMLSIVLFLLFMRLQLIAKIIAKIQDIMNGKC